MTTTTTTATAHLNRRLLELAVQGERPRCSDPIDHNRWTSDNADDRQTAAAWCARMQCNPPVRCRCRRTRREMGRLGRCRQNTTQVKPPLGGLPGGEIARRAGSSDCGTRKTGVLPAVRCFGSLAVELNGSCFSGSGAQVACLVAEAPVPGAVVVIMI
jgi:hypothetical protein